MSLTKRIEISIIISLVASVLFSVISFADTSAQIREDVLRLHVIANSDSECDQRLKLIVRDRLLSEGKEIFNGSVNIENAVEKITPHIKELTEAAENEIRNNGYNYNVRICLDKEYFTTRTYENITLPAGEYLALRVIIGEGKGRNWWCVMFPPMCVSAADKEKELNCVLNESEVNLVTKDPKFEPRFKIVEIFESLRNKIDSLR